jgi:chromosome partitioning protein
MVTVFAHPKGGTGKSTLSFHYLVYKNQQPNVNVIFVDLDTQRSVTFLNKLRIVSDGKYTPFAIAENINNEDDVINYVETYRNTKDIIIDTGGYDAKINRFAVMLADLIIVPVSFSPMDTNRLYDFLNDIVREMETELGKKLPIWIVFNRIHPNVRKTNKMKEGFKKFDVSFLNTVVHQKAIMEYCLVDGGSVFEMETRDEEDLKNRTMMLNFCEEIDRIAENIIDKE